MNFQQLISINEKVWDRYFKKISKMQLEKGKLLYPNILLSTECENFFIIELLGSNEKYTGLTVKQNKVESINSYLFQFNYEDMLFSKLGIHDDIHPFSMFKISFGSPINEKNLKGRFFFHDRWPTKFITTNKFGAVSMLAFNDNVNYIEFNDCCIVNKLEEIYRLKSINHVHIVHKAATKTKYKKYLYETLFIKINSSDDIKGAIYSHSDDISLDIMYSQFLNTYSFQKLRETTIGEFLNQHPQIFTKALSAEKILYEPELKWLEGNPDKNEKSINPDFLIKRKDGYYDICDLKLPYWNKQKLTKGKRKRRSFLQIVDEAIAQLSNYEDYFNFEKNRIYAKSQYDIEIKDPKLIIIIGNYNNYDKDEIKEASRKLKNNYLIMDYDTLNLQFYNNSKNIV
ncbi:MAG: Shedu anti-phage system protein SduA domain-containing protein [Leeuwenhoekiella sp.]